MSEQEAGLFPTWGILELMGHRRLAGRLSEVSVGGASMIRIDIPEAPGRKAFTQLYGGASIYALTPTTEEIARRVAAGCFSMPVERFELREIPAPEEDPDDDGDGEDPDDDGDGEDIPL